eukprot:NODE_3621_length_536_cov_109.439425_g3075_i0.p1 GENE.NODE_3621_length_536_cov_109.439425_g3075_i0~~NODE_3621_length_536_cov_109.439425_g3075_i0.p1  ORF type:complete len:84 (-),score=6.01 NODE_3621_length_536_cov_109.439425_g3075_i0:42-293(-)
MGSASAWVRARKCAPETPHFFIWILFFFPNHLTAQDWRLFLSPFFQIFFFHLPALTPPTTLVYIIALMAASGALGRMLLAPSD